MIKLSRKSLVVRWAYFASDYIPYHTSICPLFWRVVLLAPIRVLLLTAIVIVGIGTSPLWGSIWGLSYLLGRLIRKLRTNRPKSEPQPSVIIERVKTFKAKVCPIVTIKD